MSDGERLQVEILLLELLVVEFEAGMPFNDAGGVIDTLQAKIVTRNEYLRTFC